jgi:uncharacterized protein YjbI with pentapeptide repeats
MNPLRYVDEDKISTKLLCSICQTPAIDPLVHGGTCNNLFCKPCIMAWLRTNPTCPKCRAPCSKLSLSDSGFIVGLLHELKVFCPNEEHGCKWTGDRGDVQEHIKRFCERVPCSMMGCTEVLPGTLVDKHLSTCKFVVESCPDKCGERVSRRELSQHLQTCPKRQELVRRIKRQEKICDALNPVDTDVMFINCGGKVFAAARSVLTKFPESVLGVLFLEASRKLNRDSQGHVHINCSTDVFRHLLTWLQYEVLSPTLSEFEVLLLEKEAKRWELHELESCLALRRVPQVVKKDEDGEMFKLTQELFFQLVAIAKDDKGVVKLALPGADLRHIRLSGFNLRGSRFHGCNAVGVDFRYCDLSQVEFDDATLDGADFRYCNLLGAKFGDASLEGADFRNCNMQGCKFGGARLINASFDGCKVDSNFEACLFDGADLSGASLRGCTLLCSSFRGATLDGAKFEGSSIEGLKVAGSELLSADFGAGVRVRSRYCPCPAGALHEWYVNTNDTTHADELVCFCPSEKIFIDPAESDGANDWRQNKLNEARPTALSAKREWESKWGVLSIPKVV